MADPRAVVPYHDPYGSPYTNEDLLSFISTPNPSLSDLTLNDANVNQNNNPSVINNTPLINNDSFSFSFPQSTDQISQVDDPILTWAFEEAPNDNNTGNFSEGTSQNNWQIENILERGDGGGNSRPMSAWPQEPNPFLCNCCQVLRELIHTNGQDITRLEIHGRIGFICHAVLEIQPNAATCEVFQYQMMDLCKKSIEEVKQYLEQYCLERFQTGFVMVQDSLASFYKALCVGLDWDETWDAHEFINPLPPPNPAPMQTEQSETSKPVQTEQSETSKPEPEKKKSQLAAQRERTGKMTLRDIGTYFHLPIEEAARRMKLCPTVLKKICRRGGLSRWPHRKIKAIERKISTWKATMRNSNAEEKARAQAEIEKLQQQLHRIRAGP